jgi:hypothetical protein
MSIEHLQEISIGEKSLLLGTLKIALRKFCLNQEVSKSHVNFRAIISTVCKGHAGSVSKNRRRAKLSVQKRHYTTVP